MEVISSDTLIPIGFAITMFGGAVWLSRMYSLMKANKEKIAELEDDVRKFRENHTDLYDRMARIETKIDLLIHTIKK